MSKSIVVLSDGETWDDCADIIQLSDEAYNKLVCGEVTVDSLIEEGMVKCITPIPDID